jgi:hypothetical protein
MRDKVLEHVCVVIMPRSNLGVACIGSGLLDELTFVVMLDKVFDGVLIVIVTWSDFTGGGSRPMIEQWISVKLRFSAKMFVERECGGSEKAKGTCDNQFFHEFPSNSQLRKF